jgi:hypothetical protein
MSGQDVEYRHQWRMQVKRHIKARSVFPEHSQGGIVEISALGMSMISAPFRPSCSTAFNLCCSLRILQRKGGKPSEAIGLLAIVSASRSFTALARLTATRPCGLDAAGR